MMSAQAELEKFLSRKASIFHQAYLNLLNAKFVTLKGGAEALEDLAKLIRDTLILADLHGRRRTLIEFDHEAARGDFSMLPDRNPIVMGIAFAEAIEDLLSREPRLAEGYKEASRLYSEEHAFALARSSSRKLTERVQQAVQMIIAEGRDPGMTGQEITRLAASEAHDWTRAYADTVYETNVSSALTNGRFKQAEDPDVAKVIKAFEVVGEADERERPNHRAARGFIAAVDDPIWIDRHVKPPYGYRCRHGVIFASKYTLERRGLLRPDGSVIRFEPAGFENFVPDPGFVSGVF